MRTALVVASVLFAVSTARADDALSIASDSGFTPGLLPSHDSNTGFATGATGWNGAHQHATFDLVGEVQLVGPLRFVVRIADEAGQNAQPGAGLGIQWLDERKYGVASTAYIFYKTEGFTETEGEIEAVVSFGRTINVIRLALDLAYGQDPEGRERDGELALGAQLPVGHGLLVGASGRYRDALGSNGDKSTGIIRDVLGGVSSTLVVGRFGVTALVGVAGVKTVTTAMATGPAATLEVGTVF